MDIKLMIIDLKQFENEVKKQTDIDYDLLYKVMKEVGRIKDNQWSLSVIDWDCNDSEYAAFCEFLDRIGYFEISDIMYDCEVKEIDLNAYPDALMEIWEGKKKKEEELDDEAFFAKCHQMFDKVKGPIDKL